MPTIRVGCALSDANRADLSTGLRVPERLAEYARRVQTRTQSEDFFFELQPEEHWTTPISFPDQFSARETNRWWHNFRQDTRLRALIKSPHALIGVHQPIQSCDALSSNFFQKYQALEETKQAMTFAQYIGADYFVFHLATVDRWEWDRRDQINKALKIFKAFAAFYHASNCTFTPCIEILEYPKFPATGGEALALLARCQQILPETKLAFDVSHLWGSRQRMIAAKMWYEEGGPRVSFIDALDYALSQTAGEVHVFHLGGCWESETHAVPGLHPQQDPMRFQMKLDEPARVYAEAGEIDLNRVIDLLLNYSVRRDRDLKLVLEIFNRDFGQSLKASTEIARELNLRAEREASPMPPSMEKPKRTRRAAQTKRGKRSRGK